jgi:hypothetical protein
MTDVETLAKLKAWGITLVPALKEAVVVGSYAGRVTIPCGIVVA